MTDANFSISKVFNLGKTENAKGETLSGLNEEAFRLAAKSIFGNATCPVAFSSLDIDGDKVLTADELAVLNKYLDDSMSAELEEASVDNTDLAGILAGNQSMETKLTQIKGLNLSDGDLKALDTGDLKDLLNIISGAYANKPEEIVNDTLYTAIEASVPKGTLEDIVNGENSGYWLGKYGADQIAKSLKLNDDTDNSDEDKDKFGDMAGSMDFSDAMEG